MLKKLITVFWLLIVTISSFAQIKVAILPTTDKTGEIKYGLKLMLASSLTSAISMTDGYEAYDRIDLSSVLDEQSFQRTGMVSDDQIHKIGEMTGASFVLITEAAYIDDTHLFATTKIVNVESAKIENSAGGMMNVGNTDRLLDDCKALTDKLLNNNTVANKPNNVQSTNQNDMENGHEYVDLGLSVKWATCNVGASRPEYVGDYYAWGEVTPKTYYSWGNYRFKAIWYSNNNVIFNKYNTLSSSGSVDNKTTLDIVDDVANIKWGGRWRIPTQSEFQELIDYCIWTWTTQQNGSIGYKVTSIKYGYTDRSIFLPASGVFAEELYFLGKEGYYCSSSLNTDYPLGASFLLFDSDKCYTSSIYRYNGLSVRPVCPKDLSSSQSNQEWGYEFGGGF